MIPAVIINQMQLEIAHPSVASYQMQAVEDALVVAVMLRPVYGRAARNAVLAEVAHTLADSLRQNDSVVSANNTDSNNDGNPLFRCICVLADVDVYQSILHASPLDLDSISHRPGCFRLVLEGHA